MVYQYVNSNGIIVIMEQLFDGDDQLFKDIVKKARIYGEYGWFSDMSSHGVHLIEGKVEYPRDGVWEIGEHRFEKMLEDDDIWIKQMRLDEYWERKRIDHDDLRATLAKAFD